MFRGRRVDWRPAPPRTASGAATRYGRLQLAARDRSAYREPLARRQNDLDGTRAPLAPGARHHVENQDRLLKRRRSRETLWQDQSLFAISPVPPLRPASRSGQDLGRESLRFRAANVREGP